MFKLENYSIQVVYTAEGDHGFSTDHHKEGFNTLDEADAYLKANKNTDWTGNWAIRLTPKSIKELEVQLNAQSTTLP